MRKGFTAIIEAAAEAVDDLRGAIAPALEDRRARAPRHRPLGRRTS